MISTEIIALNVNLTAMQFLEENIGQYFCDLRLCKNFLDRNPKVKYTFLSKEIMPFGRQQENEKPQTESKLFI